MKNGFKQVMKGQGHVELQLYGTIMASGFSMFDDDSIIDANQVVKAIGSLEAERVTLLISSLGGDVNAAFSIVNRLQKRMSEGKIGTVDTVAEGAVGSAATLLFLKGESRVMNAGTRFMIHEPWTMSRDQMGIGTAAELREQAQALQKQAESLEKRTDEVADIYVEMSALTKDEILLAMKEETYYTPSEAVEAGFATAANERFAMAACSKEFAKKCLMRVPDDVLIGEPDSVETDVALSEVRAKLDACKIPA